MKPKVIQKLNPDAHPDINPLVVLADKSLIPMDMHHYRSKPVLEKIICLIQIIALLLFIPGIGAPWLSERGHSFGLWEIPNCTDCQFGYIPESGLGFWYTLSRMLVIVSLVSIVTAIILTAYWFIEAKGKCLVLKISTITLLVTSFVSLLIMIPLFIHNADQYYTYMDWNYFCIVAVCTCGVLNLISAILILWIPSTQCYKDFPVKRIYSIKYETPNSKGSEYNGYGFCTELGPRCASQITCAFLYLAVLLYIIGFAVPWMSLGKSSFGLWQSNDCTDCKDIGWYRTCQILSCIAVFCLLLGTGLTSYMTCSHEKVLKTKITTITLLSLTFVLTLITVLLFIPKADHLYVEMDFDWSLYFVCVGGSFSLIVAVILVFV